MARLGITYDDVAEAAVRLHIAHKSITVDSIREALGSTGSKSTIAPLLKRWRTVQHNASGELQASLPPALLQAVTAINAQVQADADTRIAALTTAHDLALAELRTRLHEADTLIEKQTAENETLKSQLTELKTNSESLQCDMSELKITIVKAEAEREGLTHRLANRAQHIQQLQDQLDKARAQFDHYQIETASQRGEERRDFGQHLVRSEQELKRLHEDLISTRINTAHLETRLEISLKERQHIVDEKTELQNSHQHILSAHDSVIGQNHILNTQVTKLETRSEELAKLQTAYEAKLIIAAQIEMGLREQVAELRNRDVKTETEFKAG